MDMSIALKRTKYERSNRAATVRERMKLVEKEKLLNKFGKSRFSWLSQFLDLSNGIPSHEKKDCRNWKNI